MAEIKKTPATRRTRARKAPATPRAKGMGDLAKTPVRQTRSSKAVKQVTGTPVYANGDANHRYAGFDNKQTSAYSIAGLDVLGVINLAGKSGTLPKATRKEIARGDLQKVFGKTMVRYWITNKWIEKGSSGFKITVHGLERISDRLENPSDSYGTTPDLIQKMRDFLKTGQGLAGHTADEVVVS